MLRMRNVTASGSHLQNGMCNVTGSGSQLQNGIRNVTGSSPQLQNGMRNVKSIFLNHDPLIFIIPGVFKVLFQIITVTVFPLCEISNTL